MVLTNPPFGKKSSYSIVTDEGELEKEDKAYARTATWSEANPDGRWHCFDYRDDLLERDKLNLDIFWLQDKSLDDADALPDPDVIAEEIADDLVGAYEQFAAITADLKV